MRVSQSYQISACESWDALSSYAELVSCQARDRAEFLQQCRNGTLDGVLVIYRTYESVAITGRFDEELVNALPRSVKFVCHNVSSSVSLISIKSSWVLHTLSRRYSSSL